MLSVRVLGDVVGATFKDEGEAVLFIPNSGDSMICIARDWLTLVDGSVSGSSPQDAQPAATAAELHSRLVHFGANMV